jgi:hypothetical protein
MARELEQPPDQRLSVHDAQFTTAAAHHLPRAEQRGKAGAIAEGKPAGIDDQVSNLKWSEHEECAAEGMYIREVQFAVEGDDQAFPRPIKENLDFHSGDSLFPPACRTGIRSSAQMNLRHTEQCRKHCSTPFPFGLSSARRWVTVPMRYGLCARTMWCTGMPRTEV